ncbi:protein-export chaperone SecB [Gemmatimonadota bacterium]
MPLSADLGIDIVSCRLDHIHFIRRGGSEDVDDSREVDTKVELGVAAPEGDTLSVRLKLTLDDAPVARISVAYVVTLRKTEQFRFEGSEADAWRNIAARLAPVILYPFLRETVATTLQKSGLPGPVPPILDFRRVFEPSEIKWEIEHEAETKLDEASEPARN